MEAELAGHPVFGDAQSIFDRLRTFALLFLGRTAKRWPLIQPLRQELQDGPHRQAVAVFADPVCCPGLLGRSPDAMANPGSEESEELVAATLRHLRSGAPGLPTAAGCRLRTRWKRGWPVSLEPRRRPSGKVSAPSSTGPTICAGRSRMPAGHSGRKAS